MAKENIPLKPKGPPPVLGLEAEKDLHDWVVGMQREGYPVTCDALIGKGKEVYATIFDLTRLAGTIGRGWCHRFFQRHPDLSIRNAQIIKRVRNGVTPTAVNGFFGRCARAIIEEGAGRGRIFNMDETSFVQNAKTRKVVAVQGSKNVWARTIEASFHLAIVACAPADGFVLPPTFIVPGKRINRDVMDACDVPGAQITTADAGFMNSVIMRQWIVSFALAVPIPIKRPLILILDGASNHMDASIDIAAASVGVRLVQVPPNASHIYQPLDVAVLRGVKSLLKNAIYQHMLMSGRTSVNKKEAVHLASVAWRKGMIDRPNNIVSGFREAGIFPLSLPRMLERLKLFKENGTTSEKPSPPWLVARAAVRTDILLLPPIPEQKRRRKTVDINRRILTQSDQHKD